MSINTTVKTRNYKIRKFPHFKQNCFNFPKSHAINYLPDIENFFPSEILFSKWTKWGEPDEILFGTKSGNIYLVSGEALLKEISDFARKAKSSNNNKTSPLPMSYIHIEGKNYFECYEKPDNEVILQFLKNRFDDYDIFTLEGEVLKKVPANTRSYLTF